MKALVKRHREPGMWLPERPRGMRDKGDDQHAQPGERRDHAAGAALYVGPLLVLKLHLDRRRRRRDKTIG
jgi:hypothetical protein